jgi:N-acetylmuramoyl-L-alanine amidase
LFIFSSSAFAANRTLKQGMEGSDVSTLQTTLKVTPVTGFFGSLTKAAVVNFQKSQGLTADGIVGPKTYEALDKKSSGSGSSSNVGSSAGSIPATTTLKLGMTSTGVTSLQTKLISLGYLKTTATSYFGTATKAAVTNYQKAKGLTADGIAGPKTIASLNGGSVAAQSKPYKIAIDAGHGGSDPGSTALNGLYEKSFTLTYSNALKDELLSRGYKVVMTRTSDADCYPGAPSVSAELQCRLNKAESAGSSIFVSVHMNAVTETSARGTETYYYGNGKGKTLATKIQNEVKSSLGTLNRGALEKNLYVLRYTSLPATLVEVGFITNQSDLNSIQSSTMRAKYISDLADGIDAYFGY